MGTAAVKWCKRIARLLKKKIKFLMDGAHRRGDIAEVPGVEREVATRHGPNNAPNNSQGKESHTADR